MMEDMLIVQGDAATQVMKKLHDSHVAREQAKTKQQLDDITSRIHNTLQDYDDTTKLMESSGSNMEIVADLQELEALLKDDILKNKYQQKLTIFIVGYQSICSERVDLLSQLSEFFAMYSSPSLTDEENVLSLSDNHVEALSCSVEDALHAMTETVNRLNEISTEVIGYMDHLHVAASSKSTKSKKKLEKALQNAKDEILKMTNKILQFQQDLGMKDERLQQLTAQVDAKKVEIAHLKRQQDISKKTHEKVQEDLKQERNALQIELEGLEMDLKMYKQQLLEAERSSASFKSVNPKVQEIKDTALVELRRLKTKMEAEELDIPDVKRELAEQFQVQLQQMSDVYDEEMEAWMQECRVHVHDILEVEMSEDEAQQWTQDRVSRSLPGSVMSNKDKPVSPYHTSSVVSDLKPSTAESEVRPSNEKSADDVDLLDETYWKNLPADQVKEKFELFRDRARKELARLTENLQSANALKENLAGEASKWQEERASLLAHIEQLKVLQEAAEADAEEAMRNLEEFAAEQEQLEANQYRSSMGTGAGDASNAQEEEMLTEDNVQSMDAAYRGDAGSRASVSKPASAATSRLASAYKQKIAERREAMQQRKRDRLRSESSVASPQFKGMFDTGLLEEFLRCYRSVVEFKDMISQEMSRHASHHSRAHAINAVQTSSYDASNDEVQLYVSNMTNSVEQSLKVIQENVASALEEARSAHTTNDAESLRIHASKLQDELNELRNDYEKRAQHDSAMIMHLQNTLSETQRGNTAAIGTSGSGFPSSPAGPILGKTPSSSQRAFTGDSNITVMFSRLDAEHNAKALKKSAAIGRITQETLETVVMTMDAYNAIPAKRIRHLASKVMHHTKMKVIETNVRNSNLVTSEVFAILEKMETLQRHRAQAWSRQMDELTSERRRLAALLTEALQKLECITGVFLIKPVISYRGKNRSKRYSGKISTRFNKYQVEAMLQKMQVKKSTLAQIPHQAIHVKISKSSAFYDDRRPKLSSVVNARNYQRQNTEPLTVSGMVRQVEPSMAMWNVKASQARSAPVAQQHKDDPRIAVQHPLTIPKLLELDLNRFQLDSTKVHSTIDEVARQALGDDRLKNMGLMNLRAHANVPRSGDNLPRKADMKSGDSAASNQSVGFKSSAPPTTPAMLKLEVELGDEKDSTDDEEEGEMPQPIRVIASPIPKPLPPIRTASTRSSVSPRSPNRDATPRSAALTPSRSMPDMGTVADHLSTASSPPFSARKDMGTSPAAEA